MLLTSKNIAPNKNRLQDNVATVIAEYLHIEQVLLGDIK